MDFSHLRKGSTVVTISNQKAPVVHSDKASSAVLFTDTFSLLCSCFLNFTFGRLKFSAGDCQLCAVFCIPVVKSPNKLGDQHPSACGKSARKLISSPNPLHDNLSKSCNHTSIRPVSFLLHSIKIIDDTTWPYLPFDLSNLSQVLKSFA